MKRSLTYTHYKSVQCGLQTVSVCKPRNSKKANTMNHTNEGSKLYLYSITSVAILGGLLFGYDTAVISGAEKGLEAFFLTATDFQYDKVMHGITSSSALIGCVLGGALSGIFASRLGRRNSLRLAAVLFFLSALGSYYPEFLFFEYGKADMNLLIAFNLYRIVGGIGVGLASAVCPMYIAEIAPSISGVHWCPAISLPLFSACW